MCRNSIMFQILTTVVLLGFLSGSNGLELETKLSNTSLPTQLYQSSLYYDGDDAVYLFGGSSGNSFSSDILRYSISSDSIEKVSALPTSSNGGIALGGWADGSILYIGGVGTVRTVHRFDPKTNVVSKLDLTLPQDVTFGAGLTITGSSCYIFNARNQNILHLDLESESVSIVTELPFGSRPYVDSITAIHVPGLNGENNKAWLFAGSGVTLENPLLVFDLDSMVVSFPEESSISSLPQLSFKPATVYDGRFGYIVGGFGQISEDDGSYHPANGILRFDPVDASTTFLPVNNFPAGNGTTFDRTSAVYVQRLNRIYFFGGTIFGPYLFPQNSIWYIDL